MHALFIYNNIMKEGRGDEGEERGEGRGERGEGRGERGEEGK